jgi:hypothetical protein
MLSGYNTNVPYEEEVFHVQTEDGGVRNPVITTLLYHEGAILLSQVTRYADVLNDANWQDKVAELMKRQHKNIVRKLMRGKLREVEAIAGAGSPEPAVEAKVDIEEIILDYIITR